MSITAKLYVDDNVYNILYLGIKMSQAVNKIGLPSEAVVGGTFDIDIESSKDNTIYDWMLSSEAMKDAKIVIPSRFAGGKSRTIELKDTFCIEHTESFNSKSTDPMITSFQLSPGGIYQNGEKGLIKYWHTPKPEPKKENKDEKDDQKKVTINFKANSSDLDDGKFGFDKFEDWKDNCTSLITDLEKEYNKIQVYGIEYFPVWVSIRKGKTITLKLDKTKPKNYKLFNEIKFADHPDFTFEPADLKNAREVHITCNNNNPTTTQIKIEGDGETVGAINLFYPEPKRVNLRWVRVKFNEEDSEATKKVIENNKILEGYFKKAFNASLIDINIVNNEAEILNLNEISTEKGEAEFVKSIKNLLKEGSKNSAKTSMADRTRLITSINTLHLKRKKRMSFGEEIYLYLTNLKCEIPSEDVEDDPGLNNGITLGNLSLMFYGNATSKAQAELSHEIMHAITLPHFFKEEKDVEGDKKHTFNKNRTPNYMDYNNDQNRTMYWQWQELYNSEYSK